MNFRFLCLMNLILLGVLSVFGLEIRVDDAGQTVPSRRYVLKITVSDSLVVRLIEVELNGKGVQVPDLEEQSKIRLELPVNLQWGENLISVRAETDSFQTSSLATISYDGKDDDVCDPMVWVDVPAKTSDSTVVIHGYAYDDVHVAQVTVDGHGTQPWLGRQEEFDNRGLVMQKRGCEVGDTLGFASLALPLVIGRNTLQVEVRDQRGRKVREEIQVFRDPPFTGNRWAVVVGVSEYGPLSGVRSLRYADDDAQAFYNFLLSLQGGGFDSHRTKLLLNEQATSDSLRAALFVGLDQTRENDLVVIYFSGHGVAERPELVYLMTHDANMDSLASTAFAMYNLHTALQLYIHTKRVLIIADACHSGAILSLPPSVAMRDPVENSELVSQYLQALNKSVPGRGIFVASEAREQSQEGPQWGGGHGVFTHYLLEGLQGEADSDGNGLVRLGEAIDYTQEHVKKDTKGKQHPTVGGDFDRNMPLAVLRPIR